MKHLIIFVLFALLPLSSIFSQDEKVSNEKKLELNYYLMKEWMESKTLTYSIPKSVEDLNPVTKLLFRLEMDLVKSTILEKRHLNVYKPIGHLNGGILNIIPSQFVEAGCLNAPSPQNKTNKYLGLFFKVQDNNSLLEHILYTDILFSSQENQINFLLKLLLKFNQTQSIPLSNSYLYLNCGDDNWKPIFIFPEDGLTAKFIRNGMEIRGSIPLGYVSKKYPVNFKEFTEKFISNKDYVLNVLLNDLEGRLIKRFGKDNVKEVRDRPRVYKLSRLRNLITFDNGYWEKLKVSIYDMSIEENYIELKGVFQGSYFDVKSPIHPNESTWKDGASQIRSNVDYGEKLDGFAIELFDSIWKDIQNFRQTNVKK